MSPLSQDVSCGRVEEGGRKAVTFGTKTNGNWESRLTVMAEGSGDTVHINQEEKGF